MSRLTCGHTQHMYSWWWVRLSPETCRVKPLRRIKTRLLHLVGLISLLYTCIPTYIHTYIHTYTHTFRFAGYFIHAFTNVSCRNSVPAISLLYSVSRPAVRWHLAVLSISSNSSAHYAPTAPPLHTAHIHAGCFYWSHRYILVTPLQWCLHTRYSLLKKETPMCRPLLSICVGCYLL